MGTQGLLLCTEICSLVLQHTQCCNLIQVSNCSKQFASNSLSNSIQCWNPALAPVRRSCRGIAFLTESGRDSIDREPDCFCAEKKRVGAQGSESSLLQT